MSAAQIREVITKTVQREPGEKGRQTWRGMLIKLWTSAILLLLCFVLPMKTLSRTDGAGLIPAKQSRIMYALSQLISY